MSKLYEIILACASDEQVQWIHDVFVNTPDGRSNIYVMLATRDIAEKVVGWRVYLESLSDH